MVRAATDQGGRQERNACQLLKVAEVATLLAVSSRTVWRLSATGALKGPLNLGMKTKRWRLSDVEAFLAEAEKRGNSGISS